MEAAFPRALPGAGPWITQRPNQAHVMQPASGQLQRLRKSLAPVARKSRASFGFGHGFRGDSSVPACQPCLPGEGLPAEWAQRPLW